MLKFLGFILGIGAAHAQAVGSPTYLIYPNQAACLARSQAQCVALGCDGVNTQYWWDCATGPLKSGLVGPTAVTAGSYALRVQTTGPFAAVHPVLGVGLTIVEQGKVVTPAIIAPVLPTAAATP